MRRTRRPARGATVRKAVILAGGYGTRLSEETHLRPKPMVEIGGRPLLWHIMKMYSAHGIHEFVVCCGYKGYVIKEYFANFFLHNSDVTFDMRRNSMQVHRRNAEPWKVTLVDTGEDTMTGGRIKRVAEYVDDEAAFCVTYGDGVSDVDLTASIAFHFETGTLATLTAVRPPGRYGAVLTQEHRVTSFIEKPLGDGGWINGGFFVISPRALDFVKDDSTSWESDALPRLAQQGELAAYPHEGFWQPMDTLRDRNQLEHLWATGAAPWKRW